MNSAGESIEQEPAQRFGMASKYVNSRPRSERLVPVCGHRHGYVWNGLVMLLMLTLGEQLRFPTGTLHVKGPLAQATIVRFPPLRACHGHSSLTAVIDLGHTGHGLFAVSRLLQPCRSHPDLALAAVRKK